MVNINFNAINERAKQLSETYDIPLIKTQIILLNGYTLCQDDIKKSKEE